jgi:NAD(P)-dependent dehydrogenase (short-subunit alcohol dehydrogenase family)
VIAPPPRRRSRGAPLLLSRAGQAGAGPQQQTEASMAVDKVALITAGGSGMGAAAARRLAADGFRVAVLSSSGKGEALARELGGFGVTGSNQSNDDLKRLVDQAMAQWGRIDVLVNSAGHGPRAPILEIWTSPPSGPSRSAASISCAPISTLTLTPHVSRPGIAGSPR